jgi:S-formylglutathione hydrolase FrmB
VVRYGLRSHVVDRRLRQVALVPPGGAAGRPLLVFLHGRGAGGEESGVTPSFLSALVALGGRAPVVVFPSGGDHSYWHDRRSGAWGRYVLDEVIPRAAARFGTDPARVAIGGISMGGYGAFEVARHRPAAFCAVGGHSAALWLRAGDTAPGAFDDAQDFARHDVVRIAQRRGRKAWGDAALWLDAGTADPFLPGGRALARALHVRLRVSPGGHDAGYWAAHDAAYLRFYARALARC